MKKNNFASIESVINVAKYKSRSVSTLKLDFLFKINLLIFSELKLPPGSLICIYFILFLSKKLETLLIWWLLPLPSTPSNTMSKIKQDPDYALKVEHAISQKYGSETVQHPQRDRERERKKARQKKKKKKKKS